jgi:hypothetical protein
MFARTTTVRRPITSITTQRPIQRNYSLWRWFWESRNQQPIHTKEVTDPNAMLESIKYNKPCSLFLEKVTRHGVQAETAEFVIKNLSTLLTQANDNLTLWDNQQPSPQCVNALRGDWGVITQQLSKLNGKIYAVLNMANAHFVGGAFQSGGGAQEENMFERTTCITHILYEESDSIYFDENNNYRYKPEMTELLNAMTLMTSEELEKLSAICGKNISQAYKVHMDTREPEVCFRGPELVARVEGEDGAGPKYVLLTREEGSFSFLKKNEIFPFHELRSAALDLTDRNISVDWENEEFLAWFKKDTKRRIDAQLDTVLLNGIKHVVLSAFGCGAFKNHPEVVAQIYKESIEERAEHFEHIAFAIYYPGYGKDNFSIFKHILDGIKLGKKMTEENDDSTPRLGFGRTKE